MRDDGRRLRWRGRWATSSRRHQVAEATRIRAGGFGARMNRPLGEWGRRTRRQEEEEEKRDETGGRGVEGTREEARRGQRGSVWRWEGRWEISGRDGVFLGNCDENDEDGGFQICVRFAVNPLMRLPTSLSRASVWILSYYSEKIERTICHYQISGGRDTNTNRNFTKNLSDCELEKGFRRNLTFAILLLNC